MSGYAAQGKTQIFSSDVHMALVLVIYRKAAVNKNFTHRQCYEAGAMKKEVAPALALTYGTSTCSNI